MLNFISCRRGGKVSLLSKCHNDYHGALSRLSQSWLTERVGWRYLSQSLRLVTAPLTSELQPWLLTGADIKNFHVCTVTTSWVAASHLVTGTFTTLQLQTGQTGLFSQHWLVWSSLTSVLTGRPANIIIGITAWAPGSSSRVWPACSHPRPIHLLIPHNPSWSPNLISP